MTDPPTLNPWMAMVSGVALGMLLGVLLEMWLHVC